jgi:hypothetical protein
MRKYAPNAVAAILAMTTTIGAVKTSTAGAFPVDTVTSNATAPQDVTPAYYGYWGYPRYRYGYWGYPRYRYYGYWGYPRYRYWGHRRWW